MEIFIIAVFIGAKNCIGHTCIKQSFFAQGNYPLGRVNVQTKKEVFDCQFEENLEGLPGRKLCGILKW